MAQVILGRGLASIRILLNPDGSQHRTTESVKCCGLSTAVRALNLLADPREVTKTTRVISKERIINLENTT